MATVRALAERRALVIERLDGIKKALRDDLGVEVEEQPITNREPELAQIQSLENVASVLESAHRAFTGEPAGDCLENIATQISAGLGFARSSDETPLQFLQRFGDGASELLAERVSQAQDMATGEDEITIEDSIGGKLLSDLLSPGQAKSALNPKYTKALETAGIEPADTTRKTDEELIALPGIGPAAVRDIRAAYGPFVAAE